MSEADILYSDVKFTRERGKANGSTSSPPETTYSEVRILKNESSTEPPGSQQLSVSNRQSKVTSERAALALLSVLLIAAVIALGLTSYKNIQTMERLQKLTDERDAVVKNLTEKYRKVNSCSTVKQPCPHPPQNKTSDSCPKCEEGWDQHGGKCYYFSTDSSTWTTSRDECRNQGGDLVKVDSREEQKFLELKLREKMNKPEDKFWIGLTDSEEEDTWLWTDGSPLDTSLTFWSGTEPDDWKGAHGENRDGEDCVRMGEKYGAEDLKCWFDQSCRVPHRSICEKPAQTGHLKCV